MLTLKSSLKRLALRVFAFLSLLLVGAIPLKADEISLELFQRSNAQTVTAGVKNNASSPTHIFAIEMRLGGQSTSNQVAKDLASGQYTEASFPIQTPPNPGTYALTTTVVYRNNGQRASLSHTAYLTYGNPKQLRESATLRVPSIRGEGILSIKDASPEKWKWILPHELQIVEERVGDGLKQTKVRSNLHGVTTHYPIVAVREEVVNGVHGTAIVRSRLTVDSTSRSGDLFSGRLPSWLLLAGLFAGGGAATWLILVGTQSSQILPTALGKTGARLFWASALYLLLRHGDNIFLAIATYFSSWEWLELNFRLGFPRINLQNWNPLQSFFELFGSSFRHSGQYGYFFRYVADPYWIFCSIGCFAYSYWCDREKGLAEDKYCAVFRAAFLRFWVKPDAEPKLSKAERKAQRKVKGSPPKALMKPAQLGALVLCVKLFYLPYLTTWVINNIFHQRNLTDRLNLNWDDLHSTALTLNTYLLAFFLLVDTAIFAFGYCFEHKKLKNQIRSVEPTILGWLVTLWCYPPFNTFSFSFFDLKLLPESWPRLHQWYPDSWNIIPLVIVTLCWGVFMWASIALGFKASNLTNRGIVSHGPYKYCRHPAYTIKVISWMIEGLLLGKYFGGLLFGFALIYFLRAWTEERHLSRDPEYIEYKKKVPHRFIPGVF
ncbi:MAG: hypothetical protein F6K21_17240 [Symploca sp. SIO2D2]|nr:hypothetical protein [Symploca sp. SIO2D2]